MLLGFLDGADRAIVRVTMNGPARSATLHLELDTGSQPHVSLDQDWADFLGIATTEGHRATFADGRSSEVLAGAAKVDWLGKLLEIEVIVWPRPKDAAPVDKSQYRYRGTPEGLLGRMLLMSKALSIDYVNRRVVITEPAPLGA